MKPNKENQNKESDEEEEEENDKKDDLNNILMCLCMLMIMEDTSRITLYESPIMHYLAVRGIDHATQTFRDSFHYTPILAGMLWIHRLIVLEVAVPLKAWPGLRLKSRDEQTEIRKRIDKLRRRHLCEGSFSPTASILTQLAMGKSFNKTHHSAPNINWDPDGQTIYYQGKPVVLKKIQKMWQALTQELRASMLSLTFGSPVPTIDLKSIVDSMAGTQGYRQQNYSFINHADNRKQCGGDHEYLWERAQRKEGEWKLVKVNKTSNSMEWVKPQVRTYLGKERRFLRLLMVAFHIMGGQPARGPELGSVKVSNSIYSMRNIYVMHGRVCFLTMYDKTRGRRGNTDYIMRCLPDAMGQIVAQYLVRVRPFARVLDGRESEYLFGDDGGPWDGEELSQALGSATDKHLGVRLTVSAWRHVAIGIATRRLMQASKTWEKDGEGSDDEVEGFASGDDEKELELDTFRHIMVR